MNLIDREEHEQQSVPLPPPRHPKTGETEDACSALGREQDVSAAPALMEAASSTGRGGQTGYSSISEPLDDDDWDDPRPWPSIDPAAYHGLVGEIVHAADPSTEADPVGVLITLLVGFGNAVGPGPHAAVGGDEHPARLFAVLVGGTSSGGKGTSLSLARTFLRAADSDWFNAAQVNGFASGEAIIARLSGAHRIADDATPIEKRAFVIEPEFGRLLTVNARDGSTSSAVLRGAWDDGRLQLIRSLKSMLAENTHVSILGHITPEELRKKLSSVEIADGFANRFLFPCVRRSKKLPSPPPIDQALIDVFAKRLRVAIDTARTRGILERTDEATALWCTLYNAEAERDDLVGTITGRWSAQKLRLSVVYALLDGSAEIRPEHVRAAEAVWQYCVQSAEHVFGGLQGNATADRVLDAVRQAHPQGLDREALRKRFSGHVNAAQLTASIKGLERQRLVRVERVATTSADGHPGRPRDVTYAVRRSAISVKSAESKHGRDLTELSTLSAHHTEDVLDEDMGKANGAENPRSTNNDRASSERVKLVNDIQFAFTLPTRSPDTDAFGEEKVSTEEPFIEPDDSIPEEAFRLWGAV